jgi:alkylhydroperoxidase family enzyme
MGTVTSFTIDEKLAPAGAIAGLFADLSAKFWDQPHIDAQSIELCRLALAVQHKAIAEQAERHPAAKGLPQAKIDAVLNENWRKEAGFTEAERALLDFTEYYFMDPQSIPDDVAAKVIGLHGENGLVCLVEALGFIDSRIRLSLMFSTLAD